MKNNTKRILSVLLAVLLCVSMVVPVFAADEHDHECTTEHVKENGTFIETVEPVCGNYGYTIYECNDCNHYFAVDLVKPSGTHEPGKLVHEAIRPTCTTEGKQAAYDCKNCDELCNIEGGKVATLPKLSEDGKHDIEGLEPVKVVDGVEYYECKVCGAEVTVTVACPEGKHTWGTTPASIEVGEKIADGVIGTATYACKDCGVTKEVPVIWDHAHADYLVHHEAVVPEHCEAEGNIEYWECTFCGMKFLDEATTTPVEEVENNGKHTYDNEPTYIAPTCTAYGFTFYACTVCGKHDADRTITHKPLGHTAPDAVAGAVDATCEADGYTGSYVCTVCGTDVAGTVITKTGHDYVKVTVAATCSVYAYTFEYCANDNCTHAAETTVDGYDVTVEDKDGNKVAVNYKPDSLKVDVAAGYDADNHQVIEQIVNAPTCTTVGGKYYYCKTCNYDTDIVEIPALGHNYDVEKGATIVKTHTTLSCTTDYKVDIKCANCDVVKTNVVLAKKTGHDTAKAELQTKLPTCQEDGKTYKVCATCKVEVTVEVLKFKYDVTKHYDSNEAAIADHPGLVIAEDEYHIDRAGTCTLVGLYRFECEDCGKAVLVKIDGTGTGHVADESVTTFADGTPFKPASPAACEVEGYTGDLFCVKCEQYIKGATIKALEHNKVAVEAKAPTCTETGLKAGEICTICDKVFTAQEIIPATGHNWVVAENGDYVCDNEGCGAVCDHSGKVVADSRVAACELYGYVHYVCECGYECVTDYVEGLEHVTDEGTTTPPTCTEDGKTVYTCTVCAKVLKTDVIPATGHKNAAGETIVESCTDKVTDRVCVNCNTTIGQECKNLYTTIVDATCTEYGYVLVVCKDCGEHTITIDDTKEPLTHDFSIFVEVVKPATPVEQGEATYKCSHCGEVTILPIDYEGTNFGVTVDNAVVSGAEYINGSTVKVTVTVDTEAIDVWGLDLDITFSSALLQFKSIKLGEVFADETVFGTSVVNNGNKLSVLAVRNNSVDKEMVDEKLDGQVVVAEIYFTVKASSGSTIVIGATGELIDSTGVVIDSREATAQITTVKALDIDDDGDVDLADLNKMMKIFTGDFAEEEEVVTYDAAADINNNGVIDVEDIKVLMETLLKD